MNDTLTLAIIGHLVGDYLLQNDWMALNKKQPNGEIPCLIHSNLWAIAVMSFAGWWSVPHMSAAYLCLWLPHYVQDRTNIVKFWMTRINRQPKFVEPPMAPWSLIVVDNVWHIVAIWAVWKWVVA